MAKQLARRWRKQYDGRGLFKGTEVLLCKILPAGVQYRWNDINIAQEFSFYSLAIRLGILICCLLCLDGRERARERERAPDFM